MPEAHMSKADNVLVEIFNHQFRLESDSKESDYIQKAAAYLDEKMKQAAIESGKKSPFDIAILAAMEIAEEVLDERAKAEHLLNQADERITSVTERLEVKNNDKLSDASSTEDGTSSESEQLPLKVSDEDDEDEIDEFKLRS